MYEDLTLASYARYDCLKSRTYYERESDHHKQPMSQEVIKISHQVHVSILKRDVIAEIHLTDRKFMKLPRKCIPL